MTRAPSFALPMMLLLTLMLTVASALAAAGTASGSSGLALSALVAANSPTLAPSDKAAMAALFDGQSGVSYPAGHKIVIAADGITCLAGNVDITRHSCVLQFGSNKITLTGRQAHEIFATLVEVGVTADGALGTIYESLTHLSCTVDPNEVEQNSGEGASCSFVTDGP
ncbi:MAG: hypothetical protein WBF58_03970 [Xanthobacteraceae bacterium]